MQRLQLHLLPSVWPPIHLHVTMPLTVLHIYTVTNEFYIEDSILLKYDTEPLGNQTPTFWVKAVLSEDQDLIHHRCIISQKQNPKLHSCKNHWTHKFHFNCTADTFTHKTACPRVTIFIPLSTEKCIIIHWFNATLVPSDHLYSPLIRHTWIILLQLFSMILISRNS
jgi:hypothetical protein